MTSLALPLTFNLKLPPIGKYLVILMAISICGIVFYGERLSHEGMRDGKDNGVDGQKRETQESVIAHAKMALATGAYLSDPTLALEVAILQKFGEDGLRGYADKNYDSSADYWKIKRNGDIVDDGRSGVYVEARSEDELAIEKDRSLQKGLGTDTAEVLLFDNGSMADGLAFALSGFNATGLTKQARREAEAIMLRAGYSYDQNDNLVDSRNFVQKFLNIPYANIATTGADGSASKLSAVQDGIHAAIAGVKSTEAYKNDSFNESMQDVTQAAAVMMLGGMRGSSVQGLIAQNAMRNVTPGSLRSANQLLLPEPLYSNPWVAGGSLVSRVTTSDTLINMVMAEKQTRPGDFATFDIIFNELYARNNLAITPAFKPEVSKVQQFLMPAGTRIQEGLVGPQNHNGTTYSGGGSQIQILNLFDKKNLMPFGAPYWFTKKVVK